MNIGTFALLSAALIHGTGSAQDSVSGQASDSSQAPATDYIVLASFGSDDPYDAAATRLAKHRNAAIVRFEPDELEPVREALELAQPRYVALVMRPEQVEFAFGRRFLQLATELDEDPFVDFSFGYITGANADDAVALVDRGIARKPRDGKLKIGSLGGGVKRSAKAPMIFHLQREMLPGVRLVVAGDETFPEAGRDIEFMQKSWGELEDCDTVTFIGHGWPREVVGGPRGTDLADVKFDDAVVLNVACYTGVSNVYFDGDYQRGVMVRKEVPLDESFCLSVLKTGVVGYTAYLCPRPAGPELDTDLAALIADGLSLGEARRRDYDKTVLGFIGYGEERLALEPVADGAALRRSGDAVRDIMLEGATGGVVFGDPAVVPFQRRKDQSPVDIEVDAIKEGLRITAKASRNALYLQCSDPTAKFDGKMAMRIYARIPLGSAQVQDVVVDEVKVGRKRSASRVLWVVEEDHGERFLQLKINFPRADRMTGKLSASARVLTTEDSAEARQRGGFTRRHAPPPRTSSPESPNPR